MHAAVHGAGCAGVVLPRRLRAVGGGLAICRAVVMRESRQD
jgi:hypothetical protein